MNFAEKCVKLPMFSVLICILLNVKGYQVLSVDDILNAAYLPGTLLFENAVIDNNNAVIDTGGTISNVSEGEFSEAFVTMGFHR